MKKTLPLLLAGLAVLWALHDGSQVGEAPPATGSPGGPVTQSPPAGSALPPDISTPPPGAKLPGSVARRADFLDETPSRDARQMADWVLDSGNNEGRPFAIVDKLQARVFVFDAVGRLQGAAPALLGLATGDDSVPGIGERPIPDIQPHERTTPAGRFVAEPGRNANGEDVVWVDYDAAISMHRVRPIDPREQRLERLASASPQDNRISYGCINLPVDFFDRVVSPMIGASRGIVYVLPETRTLSEVFGAYPVAQAEGPQQQVAGRASDEAFWHAVMAR